MKPSTTLVPAGPHAVTDGVQRYPVVEGIPYLRSGRDALRQAALDELSAGRTEAALVLLLADRDDWARGPGPQTEDLRALVRSPDVSLRDAMQRLAYGPVADYFAYRWSDPTYLSGLALLQLGLPRAPKLVVEVACGIGHYLRELGQRSIPAVGVDVVFSKLWLARRYVAPDAELLCADATSGLPLHDGAADAVFCHDAFYFMEEKARIAAELRRVSSGAVLVGHVHNREVDNFSSGAPLTAPEYAALFPEALLFDDAELTRAFLERRVPEPASSSALRSAAALSLADRVPSSPTPSHDFARPEGRLRINPLFGDGERPQWPSDRYEAEYAPASAYLQRRSTDLTSAPAWSPEIDDLTRRRVLLSLPDRW